MEKGIVSVQAVYPKKIWIADLEQNQFIIHLERSQITELLIDITQAIRNQHRSNHPLSGE
jgi:hypothetical protein